MNLKYVPNDHTWFHAELTAMATGIFTENFYPPVNTNTKRHDVFFTLLTVSPSTEHVIIASRQAIGGIRLITKKLAGSFLIPGNQVETTINQQLNNIVNQMKV